ncbi:MAG: FAD:protein FMN transferase [Clostridia bacterium]|nr:FAD:protein FMN transferase [Clostridia bacterium]
MKRRLVLALSLVFCLLYLCSCATFAQSLQVWAYDTLCTAKVWGGTNPSSVFSEAAAEGQNLISPKGDKQFYAQKAGDSLPLTEDLARILRQAEVLCEKTEGVFDLTVAPLSDLWDVNSATEPPSSEAVGEVLSRVGWDKLIRTDSALIFPERGMGIDIGSVGKGYGADKTVLALKAAGAEAGVLSFGGNVALFGSVNGEPFRVGIRDPKGSAGETFGELRLTDTSVVTSGGYERFFDYEGTRYHHLLDAKTGYPRQSDLLSVTVACADGAQADLASTALWLMGEEKGLALYEALCENPLFRPFDVIFLCEDGRVLVSDGLKDAFTLTSQNYRWEKP